MNNKGLNIKVYFELILNLIVLLYIYLFYGNEDMIHMIHR